MGTKPRDRTLVSISDGRQDRLLLWMEESARREVIIFPRGATSIYPNVDLLPNFKAKSTTPLIDRKYTVHLPKESRDYSCVSKQSRAPVTKLVIPTTALQIGDRFTPLYFAISGALAGAFHNTKGDSAQNISLGEVNENECSLFYVLLISRAARAFKPILWNGRLPPYNMRDVQFENFRVTILYTFSGLPTQKQALAFHTEAIAEQEYRSFENSAATKPQNSLDEKGVESHFRFQFAEMTRILGKNFIPDRYAKEFHYELFADPFTNGALAPSYLKRQIRAELFRLTTMFGPPD